MLVRLMFAVTLFAPIYSHAEADGDQVAIDACLSNWGKHPFAKKNADFRTISSKVRVLGVGDGVDDETVTDKPELILVKPNVTVLSKTDIQLMNPNGWYCLKANVAVLGKTTVKLNCKANLATSRDGATVLGASDAQGSVAVLGSARIEKVGCSKE